MTTFQGLGRGLGSLIPSAQSNTQHATGKPGAEVLQVPVESIEVNPRQPRTNIQRAELEELMNSIKEHGILQPLLVTPTKTGYQLIAGERRFQSARYLQLATVPAIVRPAEEIEKLELALIENIQRQELNGLDRAVAYQQLVDEFGLTQEAVAKKMGLSRSQVANTLRLLTLPEEIQKAIREKKISEGHAKVLLAIASPADQVKYLKKIIADELSVRDVESQVRQITVRTHKRHMTEDPEVAQLEQLLSQRLGTKVRVHRKGERGQIVIEFYSNEEFHSLQAQLTH